MPCYTQLDKLVMEKCMACKSDSPIVGNEEMETLLPAAENWQLISENGIRKLDRLFRFSTFTDAMAFSNKIALVAEDEGHHPRIVTEWGRVRVTWWTHKIRNLHRNDFLMAIKTNAIFQNQSR